MKSFRQRLSRILSVLALLAVFLTPLISSAHSHEGSGLQGSETSCALCIVSHHSPAAAIFPGPVLRQAQDWEAVVAPAATEPQRRHGSIACGRAPPSRSPSFI